MWQTLKTMADWDWQLINSFAWWLSAVGTTSAVIVALVLASRTHRIKLKLSAGHRLIFGAGASNDPVPEVLAISVTNTGVRVATVTHVGWQSGFFTKRYAVQLSGTSDDLLAIGVTNPKMPVTLEDGANASWYVRLDTADNWLERYAATFCRGPFPKISARFIYLHVSTSTGKDFKKRIEHSLRVKIIEAVKASQGR